MRRYNDSDMLEMLQRVSEALHIVEQAELNEALARIRSLGSLGISPEQIVSLTISLHREHYCPGGRRPNGPAPLRIRTERQRRKLKKIE